MRFKRLFLGLAVILSAVWVIVGEQITGASSDAVVNARLSTVRAPIAGTLDMPFRSLGSVFSAGEEIATLSDPLADDVRLNDLRMERAFVAAEVERLVAFGVGEGDADTSQITASSKILANLSLQTAPRVGTFDVDVYLTEARSRLTAIDMRIVAENTRVAILRNAHLTAPSHSTLWEVLADDGEVVQRGQDVVKLMLCNTALVTLSVPGNVYNRLSVGQSAKFRLSGTEALYDGTITRIAGAGAETIYRNLAVAPSIKHLERYDVSLLVPELRKNTELRCTVGQTGRVFFDTRPLDWVRSLLN